MLNQSQCQGRCLKVSQVSRALHQRSWLGTNARARVMGPAKLLGAELFAFSAGCNCDCALGSGNSTTVKVLLLPLSRVRDVVDVVVVEETASAGVSHGATGERDTGLWRSGVSATTTGGRAATSLSR